MKKRLENLKNQLRYLLLTVLLACSSSSQLNQEMAKPGHHQLYSHPERPQNNINNQLRRIVIASINDFHGELNPKEENYKIDQNNSGVMKVGGAEILSSYFNILRKTYGNQLLLLDAGDHYQGTLLSNYYKGEPVVKFYNKIQFDALTIGNHEFDFGPAGTSRMKAREHENAQGQLIKNIKKMKSPYLNSNILDVNRGKAPRWKNIKPYIIKEINGVKVGIIGGITEETPYTTISSNIRGLFFKSLAQSIMTNLNRVRAKGAKVVVLLLHAGVSCSERSEQFEGVRKEKLNFEPKDSSLCDETSEVAKLIDLLPPKSVHAIVGGHIHHKTANFIKGIPVIHSAKSGQYINRLELFYNTKKNQVERDQTIIHQPTKTCHEFFVTTNDCYTKEPIMNYKEKTLAKFLGEEVTPDPSITKLLSPYRKGIEKFSNSLIARIPRDLSFSRQETSPMGKIVTDAMKSVSNSMIAFTNIGGVRSSLNKGPIHYKDAYSALPFDNYLVTMDLKGKELKQLVKIATSGHARGLGLFSGISVRVSKSQDKEIAKDINNDGEKSDWERDRTLDIRLENGSPILDDENYSFVTNDFVAIMGGDNYGFVFNKIDRKRKKVHYDMSYRDAFIKYLKEQNKIKFKDLSKVNNSYLTLLK